MARTLGWLLSEFVLRLGCGLSLATATLSSREVPAGFFRVQMWIALGLSTTAAIVSRSDPVGSRTLFWIAVAAAVVSYAGAVCWLYERARPGWFLLVVVAALQAWGGSYVAEVRPRAADPATAEALDPTDEGTRHPAPIAPPRQTILLETLAGALLLGFTMTAMLLGHWHLNVPTMQLGPLRGLVLGMGLSVLVRAAVTLIDPGWMPSGAEDFVLTVWALRWLAGIVGVGGMAIMAWQTLRIPNTQSATGILYVGVILAFIGEVVALMITA